MKNRVYEAVNEIIRRLQKNEAGVKTAFAGFDACIDYIVKVVKEKKEDDVHEYFMTTDELTKYLSSLGDKSCGLELDTKLCKPGGNMVITANALGVLGVYVDCVGTFGMPEIQPVFKKLSPNCALYTIAETISATALEFEKSKIIMFDPGPYDHLSWDDIKSRLGNEKLKSLLAGKDLYVFLNWSEIRNSTTIWKGILDEILPEIPDNQLPKVLFTDFSDFSRRTKPEIISVINLLKKFRQHIRIELSLNKNEADLLALALNITEWKNDVEYVSKLYKKCEVDVLIIHRVDDSIAFNGVRMETFSTFLCNEPKILTGGGDNFNAGYCFSHYYNLDMLQSLIVANAVSGLYVKNGKSPDLPELLEFLKEYSGSLK
jgi:hypothetical protein